MGQYKSQHTGPQIDAGINAALNPDVSVTPDSDALVTSGAVADALDNIDPTITSDTDTTLNGILVGNGSKVGTKSLDTSSLTNDGDHVPVSSVVKSALTSLESDLASIQATGNTNATGSTITNGTYFYLNGILVQAKADIASGATFTNGTNYTVVTAGALNLLSWKHASSGSDALTNAKQMILYVVTGAGGGVDVALSIMIPVATLTTTKRFFIVSAHAAAGGAPYYAQIYISKTEYEGTYLYYNGSRVTDAVTDFYYI